MESDRLLSSHEFYADRSLRNASIGIGIVTSLLVCVFIIILIIYLFVNIGPTENYIFKAASDGVEGYKVSRYLTGKNKEKFMNERYPKIKKALQTLPPKEREAFILKETMAMKTYGIKAKPNAEKYCSCGFN